MMFIIKLIIKEKKAELRTANVMMGGYEIRGFSLGIEYYSPGAIFRKFNSMRPSLQSLVLLDIFLHYTESVGLRGGLRIIEMSMIIKLHHKARKRECYFIILLLFAK